MSIQIRRGKTTNWRKTKLKPAAGQPGYDKDKHKLKVGDGETYWEALPYATGLFAEEILNSEKIAKERLAKDYEDTTLVTYGTESPDEKTVGQLYLQYYDTEPEVDYIVEFGTDGIWTYQKWKSGIAKCWGTYSLETAIKTEYEGVALYYNDTDMLPAEYPIQFISTPVETATLISPNVVVWLAGNGKNTTNTSATYRLISPDNLDSAKYDINIQVNGFWRQ